MHHHIVLYEAVGVELDQFRRATAAVLVDLLAQKREGNRRGTTISPFEVR